MVVLIRKTMIIYKLWLTLRDRGVFVAVKTGECSLTDTLLSSMESKWQPWRIWRFPIHGDSPILIFMGCSTTKTILIFMGFSIYEPPQVDYHHNIHHCIKRCYSCRDNSCGRVHNCRDHNSCGADARGGAGSAGWCEGDHRSEHDAGHVIVWDHFEPQMECSSNRKGVAYDDYPIIPSHLIDILLTIINHLQ